MRSNRLRSCLVAAALFAGTSSASAQDNTDEKTDEQTEQNAEKPAAPVQVAQAQSDQPAGPSPTEPAAPPPAAGPLTEDQIRKMVDEQVAKGMKPKQGISLEFTGYGRAGVGLNIRGGHQVCYGLAGADTKWRLGNE